MAIGYWNSVVCWEFADCIAFTPIKSHTINAVCGLSTQKCMYICTALCIKVCVGGAGLHT